MTGIISKSAIAMDVGAKAAALSASASVASVVTHDLPDDMIVSDATRLTRRDNLTYVFGGSGIIVECEDARDGFVSVIIAPATLFKRTNNVPLDEIKIDVYLSGGHLYKGHLLACDFHYNLAAVSIHSDSKLHTATLKDLDDVTYINLSKHLESCNKRPFQLRRHSNSFKILPGTEIMSLWRTCLPPYDIRVIPGVFSAHRSFFSTSTRPCKELFWLTGSQYEGDRGGAVINLFGEVIGIMFCDSPFLPSNIISRWWNHFKNSRDYCRPWLGVDILNLLESDLKFLEQFARVFPNVITGVVVVKGCDVVDGMLSKTLDVPDPDRNINRVDEDSPAYRSGIQPEDVIVTCDGKPVRSNLEFFERMWDTAGRSMELNVLRARDGQQLDLSEMVEETTEDKFYKWPLPSCNYFTSAV